MTLIAAEASWRFAIQVTDRLVTRGARPFDPVANKNLVYVAPDGIIALGYTGLAYLDEIPSDQWLAEKLIGERFRERRPPMLGVRSIRPWRGIGPAVQHLHDELQAHFLTMTPASGVHGFEILGVGWQWNRRGRHRPILLTITKEPDQSQFSIKRWQRHFGRGYQFVAVPDGSAGLIDFGKLEEGHRSMRSIDDAEGLLADAIRGVAAATSVVGPNCMSIVIPSPQSRAVRIRYIGEPAALTFTNDATSSQAQCPTLPAAFSPWVIGPGGFNSPSILSGTFTISAGGFSILLQGPEAGRGSTRIGAIGSLERPRPPTVSHRAKQRGA